MLHYFSHKWETDQLSDKSKGLTQTFDFAYTAGRPKNEHCVSFFTVDRMKVIDVD